MASPHAFVSSHCRHGFEEDVDNSAAWAHSATTNSRYTDPRLLQHNHSDLHKQQAARLFIWCSAFPFTRPTMERCEHFLTMNWHINIQPECKKCSVWCPMFLGWIKAAAMPHTIPAKKEVILLLQSNSRTITSCIKYPFWRKYISDWVKTNYTTTAVDQMTPKSVAPQASMILFWLTWDERLRLGSQGRSLDRIVQLGGGRGPGSRACWWPRWPWPELSPSGCSSLTGGKQGHSHFTRRSHITIYFSWQSLLFLLILTYPAEPAWQWGHGRS